MKHAIAISTYTTASGDQQMRLETLLASLEVSGYPGKVFVIDDGSKERDWLIYDTFDFELIRRQHNGGVSRCKNTCLRVLTDYGVDVGFLLDDDAEILQDNWYTRYLDVHALTDCQHLSWWNERKQHYDIKYNQHPVTRSTGLNGILLTFTLEVVDKVGGFPVTKCEFGYDHVNWSNRIVAAKLAPFWMDIRDSNVYVRISEYGKMSAVTQSKRKAISSHKFPSVGKIYQPIVE